MGHLVNPVGYRVGVTRGWSLHSYWSIGASSYSIGLAKDLRLLRFFEVLFKTPFFRYKSLCFSHFKLFFSSSFTFLISFLYVSDIFSKKISVFLFFLFLFNKKLNKFFRRSKRFKYLWRPSFKLCRLLSFEKFFFFVKISEFIKKLVLNIQRNKSRFIHYCIFFLDVVLKGDIVFLPKNFF